MESDTILRLGFFAVALIILATIEHIFPRQKLTISKKFRWSRNLSLIIINSIAVKILLPFTLATVAIYAQNNDMGLFNYFSAPPLVTIILSFIVLDLLIYAQHVAFHHIPIFWRFHKIHHIDQEIDVTTGLRFHPIEILLSHLIKCYGVLVLGAPVLAVIIFEITLNVMAMFTHSNLKLPNKLDKYIRLVFVTPDMHRVHHSTVVTETNSNFGFNFSFWDKFFTTYKDQPQSGHKKMKIGLKEYPNYKENSLKQIITLPFTKQ